MKLRFIYCSLLLLLTAIESVAQEPAGDQSSTWRFEFANDAFVDSDNQFTNGFALQKHSAIASSLDATGGTAAFGKSLARFFLPDDDSLSYRESWAFGQNMQTPELIEVPDLILDDVPYLGILGWGSSFIAYDDHRMSGFGWMVGIVGPSSFAEEVQKAVHKLVDAEEPQGWDNQLDDEPILSFFYTHKRKIWRTSNFDGALAFGAGLSNFVSYGSAALEMRFGRLPKGFTYVPDPIGAGLSYNATVPIEGRTAIYGSLVVRGTGWLVNMPRKGNTFVSDNPWTELNTIEAEDSTAQVYAGINFERPKWALRLNFWAATASVKTDTLAADQDPENRGGTITIEWRF